MGKGQDLMARQEQTLQAKLKKEEDPEKPHRIQTSNKVLVSGKDITEERTFTCLDSNGVRAQHQ